MSSLNIDSWWWKIALMVGLIGARELVRALNSTNRVQATAPGKYGSRMSASQTHPDENVKGIIEFIDSLAIAIGLVLFIIQPFLVQAFFIPSGSMEDTLRIDDRLLVSKLIYRIRDPHFQDVVVFRAPQRALETSGGGSEGGETDYIKRCMGTPGDVVYVKAGVVYRKAPGEAAFLRVAEPYVKWSPGTGMMSYDMKVIDGKVYSREYYSASMPQAWECESDQVSYTLQAQVTDAAPGPIPADEYLVLGDHRNNSHDGHKWGFVPRENFIGKALCLFWPPTRVGVVDSMSFHPRAPQVDAIDMTLPPPSQ